MIRIKISISRLLEREMKNIYDANLEPKFYDRVVANLKGISEGKKLG